MNCSTESKPQVIIKERGESIVLPDDPMIIYSGMYASAIVNSYCYSRTGNRGFSFGLMHLLKMGDGPRLDFRITAEEGFKRFRDSDPGTNPFANDNKFEPSDIPNDDDLSKFF